MAARSLWYLQGAVWRSQHNGFS